MPRTTKAPEVRPPCPDSTEILPDGTKVLNRWYQQTLSDGSRRWYKQRVKWSNKPEGYIRTRRGKGGKPALFEKRKLKAIQNIRKAFISHMNDFDIATLENLSNKINDESVLRAVCAVV